VAENNGAPTSLVERFMNLRKGAEFSNPNEAAEALERDYQSHDHALRSRRGNL